MPVQNISPVDHPQAVRQEIERLAQHIVVARKRRGETQAQWAKRLGVSQPTMARIERGDPSVAMASYVMCMWLINQAEGLPELIAPERDMAALDQEVRKVRGAARKTTAQWPAVHVPAPSSTPRAMESHPSVGKANAAGLAALLNPQARTSGAKL